MGSRDNSVFTARQNEQKSRTMIREEGRIPATIDAIVPLKRSLPEESWGTVEDHRVKDGAMTGGEVKKKSSKVFGTGEKKANVQNKPSRKEDLQVCRRVDTENGGMTKTPCAY